MTREPAGGEGDLLVGCVVSLLGLALVAAGLGRLRDGHLSVGVFCVACGALPVGVVGAVAAGRAREHRRRDLR